MEVRDVESLPWFPELVSQIQVRLEDLTAERHQQRPALQKELEELLAKVKGWSQSLAKPDLDPTLRAAIEAQWSEALERQQEIEQSLAEEDAKRSNLAQTFHPQQVVDRLSRLENVLASNNPTLGNLELSLHIDRIKGFPDGRVVMRTSKLGALTGTANLIRGVNGDCCLEETSPGGEAVDRVPPRRRARLRVVDSTDDDLKAAVDVAIDPHRFAGLNDSWFWEDIFQVPEPTCWAEQHAAEVARVRATGLTMEQLASHFGRTPPTIRSALRYAANADESVRLLPKKMPRRRWTEDHATEVAILRTGGMSVTKIAKRFGKSETTIRESLDYSRQCVQKENGDGKAAADQIGGVTGGESQARHPQ